MRQSYNPSEVITKEKEMKQILDKEIQLPTKQRIIIEIAGIFFSPDISAVLKNAITADPLIQDYLKYNKITFYKDLRKETEEIGSLSVELRKIFRKSLSARQMNLFKRLRAYQNDYLKNIF